MQRHFVTFVSPGTLFHEETTEEIESWDVPKAVEMSRKIVERHGARPFAFYFTTRKRTENDLDSWESARSSRYYLGGRVETLSEVRKRNLPDEQILLSNMECNGWDKIIVNTNSYRTTQPFLEGDVLLDY